MNLEFIRRYRSQIIRNLETMVKRSIEQKMGTPNFQATNERIEAGAMVKNRRGKCCPKVGRLLSAKSKKGQNSKGDNCSCRHEVPIRGTWKPEPTPSSKSPTEDGG